MNYFNYFTEIEEHFIRLRAKNLLLSPLDWCLIELWKDSGVPLHVALRGIERSFESAAQRQKRSPRTLYYCHPAVIEAFEEFRQAEVGRSEEHDGAGTENGEPEDLSSLLKGLERQIADRPGEVFARVRQQLSELSQASRRGAARPEDVDRALNRMGALLADWAREQLPDEQLKELRRKVRSQLKIYKKRIDPEMFERLEKSYLDKRLREEAGLPEFSLLAAAE